MIDLQKEAEEFLLKQEGYLDIKNEYPKLDKSIQEVITEFAKTSKYVQAEKLKAQIYVLEQFLGEINLTTESYNGLELFSDAYYNLINTHLIKVNNLKEQLKQLENDTNRNKQG